MMQRSAKGRQALAGVLQRAIEKSLLPGDTPMSEDEVARAAEYLLETATWREPGTAQIDLHSASEGQRVLGIAIVNDDMPFLVDSVAAAVSAQGLVIDRLVHPILSARRAADGELAELHDGRQEGMACESFIYVETPRADARQRRELKAALAAALADVRAAVGDWPRMRECLAEDARRLGDGEGAALLDWLGDDRFTLLGHLTRRRDGRHAERLGICRKGHQCPLAEGTFERAFEWFDKAGKAALGRAPLAIKANALAKVHRRAPLDLFIVPVIERGRVAALSVHAGLWTSAALNAPPDAVPRLRREHAKLMRRLGFAPDSHDGKALTHALGRLPHDLVIGFDNKAVERVATTMMSLVDRPRPRLALVSAALERHLFAFVWIPREQMSTDVLQRIRDLLESATGGKLLDWTLEVEGGNLAMLRFTLDMRASSRRIDERALDARLQTMLRGWGDAVENELAKTEEPTRAAAMAARFAEAVPAGHQAEYDPAEAAGDVLRLRALYTANPRPAEGRAVRLCRREGDGRLGLKVYQLGGALPLSDAVPALENFGFRVLDEVPVPLGESRLATIHDFTLALPETDDPDRVMARAPAIEEAIAAVLNGAAENDVFNRLTVGTALSAREADLLRAFYRYLRQTGVGFTIATVVDALARAGEVAHGLIALFRACHDPALVGERDKAAAAAEAAIEAGLAKVEAINDDRLLRLFRAIIEAILRTNFFVESSNEALAFKLDSTRVPDLPKPVPWREIFVYSRRVEGIHLRAGPVARGGIRWSDRRDDYRTEILGLMKAQRVKNAVIVPTGAKGGFYPKRLPDPRRDRDGWAAEGKASYEIFIRALLTLTDNIVDSKVIHPEGIVVRDGDDPYFVVAADKGTASFSDVANAIAAERDFWLDDAFASGGSHGYDHKEMGITARGAWISVQRHFLELGVDVQNEPVSVVGVGDMSGDVFGNGMLQSRAIRLIAAFDHRHVFIDPEPDPAASWKERRRMFELPRSSWDDYDKALISKGGGVFPRTLKSIPLSPQARAALGIDAQELDPEALISAILKAPVDLLWFGGIGTYVKSSGESDLAVGDRANDGLRVDGREVRARVIGEGANLGCTQAGRIEFALKGAKGAGGRINTDFIDNSAGVDCSDNEVNIKIAFAAARREGRLSEKRRDALLVEMTDEVAELVLEDNRLQVLGLSIAEQAGARSTPSYTRLIDMLEERGELDRATEGLADSETLARRAAEGKGLTRPELAVLLSTSKLTLQAAIEREGFTEDAALLPTLIGAFPRLMQGRFKRQILGHRLHREIVATELANRIVNRMGMIDPFELTEEEGATLGHVAAAFVCAEQLFGLAETWRKLETTAMPEAARLLLFDRAALALRNHMADLLRAGAGTVPPARLIEALAPGIRELAGSKDQLLAKEARSHSDRLRSEFEAAGAPADEAALVANLFDMDGAVGLVRLAAEGGVSAVKVARAFTDLGARLGLDWAQGTAATMNPSDPWERLLVAGLARDFQQMRFELLHRIATGKRTPREPETAVSEWAGQRAATIAQFRGMIERAHAHLPVPPAVLAQIASQARNLLAR